MAVSAVSGRMATPAWYDITIATASATGTINQGDWLAYSGHYVLATFSGDTAYWKNSGAGVALESNPVYDPAGRTAINSGMKVLVQGVLHVSASFSGVPLMGLGAYPDASGSGLAAPTGATGLAATWNTAAVRSHSADPTAGAAPGPVATVIGTLNHSNAGTGELMVRLLALPPDVR